MLDRWVTQAFDIQKIHLIPKMEANTYSNEPSEWKMSFMNGAHIDFCTTPHRHAHITANITHLLILICLVNLLLAFYVTGEVLANKEIISTAKTFISFQRSNQLIIIVRSENTTSDKFLDFLKTWVWNKLYQEFSKVKYQWGCPRQEQLK